MQDWTTVQLYMRDPEDVARCAAALKGRSPISVTGLDQHGKISLATGIILAVERDETSVDRYRWRVTILNQ